MIHTRHLGFTGIFINKVAKVVYKISRQVINNQHSDSTQYAMEQNEMADTESESPVIAPFHFNSSRRMSSSLLTPHASPAVAEHFPGTWRGSPTTYNFLQLQTQPQQ